MAADIPRLGAVAVISAQTLADDDLTARNTWEEPDRIGLADNESAVSTDGVVTVRLPPVSWTVVLLGVPEAPLQHTSHV